MSELRPSHTFRPSRSCQPLAADWQNASKTLVDALTDGA